MSSQGLSDRTGRAMGTLSPVIYFENAGGHILMPPQEKGQGEATPRRLFDQLYKKKGYEWKEAGTLNDVDRLQSRLIEQEQRVLTRQGFVMDQAREHARKQTTSRFLQTLASSSTSEYEKEFIRLWMDMSEDKRKIYTQRFTERNMYLEAREFDSNHKIEDRMGD
jgi:hypothetical protein